jgi:predicted N-acetyltransferase YhbS
MHVGVATEAELPEVARLAEAYMRETFSVGWSGSLEALRRDGQGLHFTVFVARHRGDVIGFAMLEPTYDVHHCLPGGMIADLYVVPAHRGRGVAMRLIACAAAQLDKQGGRFIKGQAVPGRREEYERIAMAFEGADCIVGGRAFRALAALDGKKNRELIRGLPLREWNYQP